MVRECRQSGERVAARALADNCRALADRRRSSG